MKKIKESDIQTVFEISPNMRVPYYLILSYLYYKRDISIVSDAFFDNLAKEILSDYENISHYHKHFLTKDMLEAGTYLGKYPSVVSGSADHLMRNGIDFDRIKASQEKKDALRLLTASLNVEVNTCVNSVETAASALKPAASSDGSYEVSLETFFGKNENNS